MKLRTKTKINTFFATLFMLVYLFPIFWMVSSSFKTQKEIISLKLIPGKLRLDNYIKIIKNADLEKWLSNSFVVTVFATLLLCFIAMFAAYALSRMKFKGRKALIIIAMSGFMIPGQATMIPLFLLLKDLNLVNTLFGLIIIHVASPVAVFVLMQFFKGISNEYEEAARLDGAGELHILFKIMIPLAIPSVITIATVHFSWIWNDFFWPLILSTDSDLYTLPIGLTHLASTGIDITYAPVMAASVLTTLPVVMIFFIFQKYFMRGIAMGGMK